MDSSQFNQAPSGGTPGLGEAGGSKSMIGDFAGYRSNHIVVVPATISSSSGSFTTTTAVRVTDPVAVRNGSSIKIADNASPKPLDRVYFSYNFFDNLNGGPSSFATPGVPGSTTSIASRRFDIHEELFGFEKTFLDGNASFELRLPVFQTSGGDGGNGLDDFGDLSFGVKYAVINDCSTGNVLSGGVLVTAPTGPGINTVEGRLHDWLLQPWVGGILNCGTIYIHGFSSVVCPTDSKDVTVWFNDIGIGYNLYKADCNSDEVFTSLTPTLEVHVTTPLDHRNINADISVPDIVSFTAGVHIGLCHRSYFTVGVNVPVTGPRPYDVEALAQYNFRY
jgi:hypothetical protein